jgi:hypothetical protein
LIQGKSLLSRFPSGMRKENQTQNRVAWKAN